MQNFDCLTVDKKFTNLGVLFFAQDIDFIMNYAIVDCILFGGTEKVKILDRKQYFHVKMTCQYELKIMKIAKKV